jgi:tRNA(adenine34) deaminase
MTTLPDDEHHHWMTLAYQCAQHAARIGEVPVGAVIVKDGILLAKAWNAPIRHHDPSAHAEIRAIRKAGKRVKNYRLSGTQLYVTLEPCLMCWGALVHARVETLIFGASDPKTGVCGGVFDAGTLPFLNHRPQVIGGVMATENSQLLKDFFATRRR